MLNSGSRVRLAIISALAFSVWLLIMGKLFWIQVINHEDLLVVRNDQYTQQIILEAERGTIMDRNGKALTMNLPHYDLGVHPPLVEEPELMAEAFSETFGKPASYYADKLSSGKNFVWMERKVIPSKGVSIIERNFKGLSPIKQSKRYYPYGEVGSQIIGFTDIDNLGIEGVEKSYDEYLSGIDGKKTFQLDGKGRDFPGMLSRTVKSVSGGEVRLTIDLDYQIILREELENAYKSWKADRVIGILLQPQTGEILAMGSAPDFNPNNYTNYPVENFKNRTITDTYEPGSTFKLITAAAAIEYHVYNESDLIFCENGKINVANVSITDHKPYGWLTFNQVFYNSSNVGVIKIAQSLGRENIYNIARAFGFGNKTGISLDGESTGILRDLSRWSSLSLAEISIGYEVSVTPLQLGMAYAAVANGGYLLKPRIIASASNSDGSNMISDDVKVVRRVMAPETSKRLKELLLGVVNVGTGKKAYMKGFDVAGKSGTSQKLINGKHSNEYYASFVAFFPAENPEFLCLVIVDNPVSYLSYGGVVAAPIVKNIFTRIADSNPRLIASSPPRKIEKSVEEPMTTEKSAPLLLSLKSVSYTEPEAEIVRKNHMPNVKGLSLRAALKILSEWNLKTNFSGSGVVKKQSPLPGQRISAGSEALLTLGTN